MADSSQSNYFNAQAASLAGQVANQAARLEFDRMRFTELEKPQFLEMTALEKEKLAFAKATEVWNQSFRESSLTGTYEGVPVTQWLLSQAELTGTLLSPGVLSPAENQRYQQLQAAQTARAAVGERLSDADLAELEAYTRKIGTYTAAPTLAGQAQQAALSGMYQNQWTPEYQQLVAGLTGTFYQPGQLTPDQTRRMQQIQAAQQAGAALTDADIRELEGYQNILASRTGTQTQAAQQQAFEQAMALGGLTGYVNLPGTAGTGGVPGVGGIPGLPGAPAGAGTPTLALQELLLKQLELERQFGLSEGTLTGMYQGQMTQAAREFAQQFGLSEAAVTGTYGGAPTLEATELNRRYELEARELERQFGLAEGALSGYYGGAPTLAREQLEAGTATDLMQIAAGLRGPRNAFQYASVIGGTPSGLTDMLNSVAGRYNLPTYQGGGAAPQPVTLQNFVQDIGAAAAGQYPGYPGTGWVPPGPQPTPPIGFEGNSTYAPQTGQFAQPMPSYQVNPPGTQASSSGWNYQPTGDGSTYVYPPGISAPVQAGQISSSAPLTATNLQQIGTSTLAQQPYALPPPSTWNAENYANLGTYRQDLLKAAYEAQGHDIGAVEEMFKQSLPETGGPKTGQVAGII